MRHVAAGLRCRGGVVCLEGGWGSTARICNQVAIGNQLQRDFAFEARVQNAVNLAHAAGANLLQQAVWAALCSFHYRHRCQQSISGAMSMTWDSLSQNAQAPAGSEKARTKGRGFIAVPEKAP